MVRKIVIVGWRASETHFIELLKEHLDEPVNTIAVSGTASAAEETLQRLKDAGIKGNFEPYAGGFTEFVRSRACEVFLES